MEFGGEAALSAELVNESWIQIRVFRNRFFDHFIDSVLVPEEESPMQVFSLLKTLEFFWGHQRLSKSPNVFDDVLTRSYGLGSIFSVTKPNQAGFVQVLSGPLKHLGVAGVVNGRVGPVWFFVLHPLLNAGADLLSRHVWLNRRPAACRINSRHSGGGLVRSFSVGRGEIPALRHDCGHAIVKEQFAKPWLVMNVGIHKSQNDEFSRNVQNR